MVQPCAHACSFMVCSSLSFSRLVQDRDIALSSRQPVVTTQCFLNFVFLEHRLADTVTCFMLFKIVIILWKTLHKQIFTEKGKAPGKTLNQITSTQEKITAQIGTREMKIYLYVCFQAFSTHY